MVDGPPAAAPVIRQVAPPLPLDASPLARLYLPRPVDRYRYVAERCRGRRVLDLGAYDETEYGRHPSSRWRWLHAHIAETAAEVLGVDASAAVRGRGSIETSVGTRIVFGDVGHLDPVLEAFNPDLIVAGELIEHTPDTLGWLSQLAALAPGTEVLVTTPNATSIVNLLLALLGRENCHPDHLHVYSVRTLRTLAARVPVRDATIRPYFYDPHVFYDRVPQWAAPAVALADRATLRPLQSLFPMTAFGLILEGVLGA